MNQDLQRTNQKLREEIAILQEKLSKVVSNGIEEKDIQKRLANEIEFLKGKPEILKRPGSSDYTIEALRKERNELQEENKKLIGLVDFHPTFDT